MIGVAILVPTIGAKCGIIWWLVGKDRAIDSLMHSSLIESGASKAYLNRLT